MDEPIRVLCVFSTLNRGGAETMCMNLYRHIDRSKVQFDFVKHTNRVGAFENEIQSFGGKIYEAPRYKIYNIIAYRKWWKRFLRKHPEYYIIHGHFFTISAIYFKVAREAGRITIAHSHCTPSDERTIKSFLANVLVSEIDQYSNRRLACSVLAGRWIFKNHRFKVLKNAIESERFRFNLQVRNQVRDELEFCKEDLVLGTVGRIMHQKNPEGIISIFEELVKINKHAKLLWVGNGPDKAFAEEKVRELCLQDRVVFTGVRNDVNCLMQAMDAFILPSFFEGLPVVGIEAQAAGIRCFFSDTVTREADITGRCTYLDNSDYTRWAKEICSSDLTKVDTYEQICKAGYDIHETAQWLENFYLKIDKKRR